MATRGIIACQFVFLVSSKKKRNDGQWIDPT